MWSLIHYGTHPLHQTFQPKTLLRPSKKLVVSANRPQTMGYSTRQKTGKNPRRAISTASILRSVDRINDRPVPMEMGWAEPIGMTSGMPEWHPVKPKKTKKKGATRGLPRRSPILLLLSPKHASMRSSDGIRCFSACMIAPVMFLCRSPLKPIVSDRCGHVISRFMHQGPPNAS